MLIRRARILSKKKLFSFLLFAIPSFIFSQENDVDKSKGKSQCIVFTTESNWQAVLDKAKKENKYIFVDAFATWCMPCKMMADNTFSDAAVCNYINDKFVSVKLQMDTLKTDNDRVKSWYADAKAFGEQYKMNAFPTLLFFSPSGKLVHKAIGYKDTKEMQDVASEAIDPSKQLYTQLEQYKLGKIELDAYKNLARKARELREKKIAKEIAAEYIASLSQKDIFIKDNLAFIRDFTGSTKDKMFNVFYKNQKKVDGVMETPYYSRDFVDYLISKENVDEPYLIPATKAENVADLDWDNIYKNIKQKYGAIYADRVITGAKARWYGFMHRWPEFISNKIKYTEVYDRPESRKRDEDYYTFGLNNDAWEIFKHSTDPKQLKIALKWSKLVIEKVPNDAVSLDTYANLLYKLGKKDEALAMEEKAVSMSPKNKDLQQALEKMKANLPTWPQQ